MGAGRDGHREELAKLSIGGTDTGGAETLLEVVPDLFDHSEVSDSDLDGGGEAQGNITKCSLSVIIPVVSVIVTASANHFVLDSSGQCHTEPQSPQLSPYWTALSR